MSQLESESVYVMKSGFAVGGNVVMLTCSTGVLEGP